MILSPAPVTWLLAVLAFAALVVFFERLMELRRAQIDFQDFLKGVVNVLEQGNVDEAIAICEDAQVPVANIVAAAIRNRDGGTRQLREAVDSQGRVEVGRLERRIATLAIFGQVAPLLGLLGTILGLINTVKLVDSSEILLRSKLVSASMDSLVTAALGLAETPRPPSAAEGTDPARMLDDILKKLTREVEISLAAALALMVAALAFVFRGAALRRFLPSAIAIGGALALASAADGEVNLFHLVAMFLLAGLSIDYTVFLHDRGRAALRPALASLLTSMAGFGALYFVSFPAVSSFGLVLGPGLPLAFLAAIALAPGGQTRGKVKSEKGKVKSVLRGQTPEDARGQTPEDGVEKAASPMGMELLYLIYCVFGLEALRFGAAVAGCSAWLFSPAVRRASPRLRKLVLFTRSLADKLVVMAEGPGLPRVETDGSADAEAFRRAVEARKGVFVLSSHVGTIEVLAALARNAPRFHAWMDIARTSVFNAFYLRHAKKRATVIHPIAGIGLGTAFEAGDWLDAGECLVMAGDRGNGAFRFAKAMGHEVYFAACLAEGRGYRAVIRRLPDSLKAMKAEYFRLRDELSAKYADQVFEWGTGK